MEAKDLLIEAGEEVLAVLGDGVDAAANTLGDKGGMVLSNRRLYQTGKCLHRAHSGALKVSRGTRSVALEDIMSVSISMEKNTGLMASGVFLLFFCLINIQGLSSGEDFLTFLSIMGLILVLTSGIACIIMAAKGHKRMFMAEYPGGTMAVVASSIGVDAISEFQRKLVEAQCD